MKLTNPKQRNGFTIVEILVVVMIIGVLAGLISAAAFRGLSRAKVARNAMEIQQLSMALNQYKQQFGEYPPDFYGLDITDDNTLRDEARTRVLRHIARAFPRFQITGATPSDKWTFVRDLIFNNSEYKIGPDTFNVDLDKMNASNVLVFWLGGMPDDKGRLSGFSKDPADPFASPADVASRIGPFFEFDISRVQIQPNTEIYKYYPHGVIPGTGKPYVYFRAEPVQGRYYEYCSYDKADKKIKTWSDDSSGTPKIIDCAKPYWDDKTKGWVNADSFQLLCCGLDGKFGKENVFKSGLFVAADVPDGTNPTGIADLRKYVIGTNAKTNPNGDDFPIGNIDHIDDQTNFSLGTIGDDLP